MERNDLHEVDLHTYIPSGRHKITFWAIKSLILNGPCSNLNVLV